MGEDQKFPRSEVTKQSPTSLISIDSGLIALCIAWVTQGSTAAKVTSRKPVLALRYE